MGPMMGNDRKNSTMVPKKSPKRKRIPTDSTAKPTNERFIKINVMPPKKNNVGLILFGLAKK